MIPELLAILNRAKLELTAEEVADLLWLAQALDEPPTPETKPPPPAESTPPDTSPAPPSVPSEPRRRTPSPPPRSDQPKLYPRQPDQTPETTAKPGGRLLPLKVAAVPALPQALELERALRPLMRRIPSRTQTMLDEAATIQRVVDEQLWLPVLKPAPARWLEVALVVDDTPSMTIWQRTVTELEQLLVHLGAFRAVKRWAFKVTDTGQLRLYLSHQPTIPRRYQELLDPTGQRLILLVSDCISPLWAQALLTPWVAAWGEQGPVALLHLFPQPLWSGTRLAQATALQVQTRHIGPANRQLVKHQPRRRRLVRQPANESSPTEPLPGMPLPVLPLEPYTLTNWARAMTGYQSVWLPAVILPSQAQPVPPPPTASTSPRERVLAFRATASPPAWELIGYLAAAPLTLAVMRLVQGAMMPHSQQIHLAEVLLSGLLERLSPAETERHPDEILYDFVPGVRELLIDTVLTVKTTHIQDQLSHYLDQRLGQAREAMAYLVDPTTGGRIPLDDLGQAFARVRVQVLRRLGGQHRHLAEQLLADLAAKGGEVADLQQTSPTKPPSSPTDLPPLQTRPTEAGVEYYLPPLDQWVEAGELPAIVEQHPAWREAIVEALLETIGYTPHPTSPLRGEESGLPSPSEGEGPGERVTPLRARLAAGEALGIIGDPRPGRLVTIPAGPFIMGSDDGRDDEKPRHEVDLDYDYQIGQYPVTNAEYAAFMEAGGYQERGYWTAAGWQEKEEKGWTEPRWWTDKKYNQPNQPVVGVSWYEAVAYCNWLTARDSDSDLTGFPNLSGLPAGWVYRLPTEAEWEKAARGTDGRVYPWGDEFDWHHVNMRIGGEKVGRPSPVGIYPTGVSPYGVYDCSGNVWEWCATQWDNPDWPKAKPKPYPYTLENEWSDDYLNNQNLRSARGGSWGLSNEVNARCAYRSRSDPNLRYYYSGFRIVCAPVFDSLTLEPLTPDLESLNPEARAETAPEWVPREAPLSIWQRVKRLFGGGDD